MIQTKPLVKGVEGGPKAVVEVSSNNSLSDAFDGLAPSDAKVVTVELTPPLQRTSLSVPPWIR